MDHYGLIGQKLSHSFSESYFAEKFQSDAISASYGLFEIDTLENLNSFALDKKLKGFNVTIPFKQEILPILDSIDAAAEEIGAVNCVSVKNGMLRGYNTDAFGFEMSLKSFYSNVKGNALILGNGGSSQAVQYVLKQNQIPFKVVSRSETLNYETIHANHVHDSQLIINTTPIGMSPLIDASPDIPYEAIGSKHYVFDLVYNPEETVFLRQARLSGAKTKNGLEMLHLQAEKSWEIWNERA
jgi:shikimate dehydrogenase